jgi:NAD(P)-dependent dehydrogenase (short-subunit alcohol dehydrogenase family)
MTIEGKTVLITGANRGIGQALVDEALRRGATRVYAASRQAITHRDERVSAVVLDVTDTDMTRGFEIPKATPQSVARSIFDGVDAGEEDIFPDATSRALADGWRSSVAKGLERQYAAFVQAA